MSLVDGLAKVDVIFCRVFVPAFATTLRDNNTTELLIRIHRHHTGYLNSEYHVLPAKSPLRALRLTARAQNIRYFGPKIWNKIEEQLKTLSFRYFKRELRDHFLDNYTTNNI